MIPTHWTPVHRPDDGEHVGSLAADSPDRAVPHLLVGAALGPARSREDAAALLRQHGLRALDRRWWCRLPDPLPGGLLPAGEPEWPAPEELTGRASVPTPGGDLLLDAPP